MDASVDKRDKEETTCMQADTRSLQNPSVTRISLQFPLNRNTLAPCHRHGEKQQEEKRKSTHNKRKTNTCRKDRLSFLPFPPDFFPLLQRGSVIVLKDRQLSTKKKTSSFPPANLAANCPTQRQKTKKNS